MKQFQDDENGATAIEYGLIASIIAVAVVGALVVLGRSLQATYNFVIQRSSFTPVQLKVCA